MEFLPFTDKCPKKNTPIFNIDDLPKELEIFYQSEKEFLPEGKDFEDLSEEEMKILKDRYRFACLKPGMYQGITGFGHML